MTKHITDCTILNNGVTMPWLGFGTYKAKGKEVQQAVETALEVGYRSIDTASIYGNEEEVGQAIVSSGVARNELFVTTKLWNEDQGFDSTLRAFEASQKALGLNVIDLYLIHWPGRDQYKETWRAFERLYSEGSIRAIGVSNFQVHHLQDIIDEGGTVPAVNQVEPASGSDPAGTSGFLRGAGNSVRGLEPDHERQAEPRVYPQSAGPEIWENASTDYTALGHSESDCDDSEVGYPGAYS